MRKTYLTPAFLVLSILTAEVAFAQSYSYPTQTPSSTYPFACANISRDLSVGSRSAEVTALQNFLVSQNYPGGGSWMVTGYFGAATKQAVLNFQSQQRIAMTGIADAQTRAAIRNLTCGAAGTPYVPFPPSTPVNPYTTPPYTPAPQTGNVYISSLSVSSGPVGTSVTIYGSGFDPVYNNVYFGNNPIPAGNVPSFNNGTSITFTVPASYRPNCTPYNCYPSNIYMGIGTYPVYVTNARGTSNSLPFTVTGNALYNCPQSPWSNCGYGFGGFGNYGFGNAVIGNMYPTSGAPGTSVTIIGSGFSQRNNSVRFGPGLVTGLTSSDGTSLSFVVPSTLTGFGQQTLTVGTYNVSVTNELGATSNALPFTVTSVSQYSLTPTIAFINGPTTLTVGNQGIWTVSVNNPGNANITVTAKWGDETIYGSSSFSSQLLTAGGTQTLNFTHTYLSAGSYTIIFTASNNVGGQNSVTTNVIVSSVSTAQPILNSLSPALGRVGTLVVLNGSGFTVSGNTAHFGVGGAQNLTSSNNGTTLYFTVPAYISPCDVLPAGSVCAQYIQQVTPGTYPISVRNANGQSQVLNFTVTQ